MEKEVERVGTEEARQFLPVAKFFKAFFYIRMTERLGDIPMSESLQGEEENFTPPGTIPRKRYIPTACNSSKRPILK